MEREREKKMLGVTKVAMDSPNFKYLVLLIMTVVVCCCLFPALTLSAVMWDSLNKLSTSMNLLHSDLYQLHRQLDGKCVSIYPVKKQSGG